jgi:hypothetical protein
MFEQYTVPSPYNLLRNRSQHAVFLPPLHVSLKHSNIQPPIVQTNVFLVLPTARRSLKAGIVSHSPEPFMHLTLLKMSFLLRRLQ